MLKWPLSDQQLWAARKMNDITDAHTLALHIAGWKIVADGPDPDDGVTPKWPFSSKDAHCDCPEWCNDLYQQSRQLKSYPLSTAANHRINQHDYAKGGTPCRLAVGSMVHRKAVCGSSWRFGRKPFKTANRRNTFKREQHSKNRTTL